MRDMQAAEQLILTGEPAMFPDPEKERESDTVGEDRGAPLWVPGNEPLEEQERSGTARKNRRNALKYIPHFTEFQDKKSTEIADSRTVAM
jgi:hypothetical protein